MNMIKKELHSNISFSERESVCVRERERERERDEIISNKENCK